MEELTVTQQFIQYRTGDILLSAGENIGDFMIFLGRHTTMQHSCMVVWMDKEALGKHEAKVHPHYIDDDTTVLSFIGITQNRKMDLLTGELKKGLILSDPDLLPENSPIVYVRKLNRHLLTDEYVARKMEEYIKEHHSKMNYLYGFKYIVTVGLGFDVFDKKSENDQLCSGAVYVYLKHLCDYPNFKVDGVDNLDYFDYKVPDAEHHMYVPDFYSAEYNTHPVFDSEEHRIISKKSEEDATIFSPIVITFVVLVLIIIFIFAVISTYCTSCRSGNGVCMIKKQSIFDWI